MTRLITAVSRMALIQLIVLVAAGFRPASACDDEISLHDSTGHPVAYIASDDDATIYLWSGTPVAYVNGSSGDSLIVWGFSGKHLGWLYQGVLFDHDGDAVCVTKAAYPGITELEPFKGLKEIKPLKSL